MVGCWGLRIFFGISSEIDGGRTKLGTEKEEELANVAYLDGLMVVLCYLDGSCTDYQLHLDHFLTPPSMLDMIGYGDGVELVSISPTGRVCISIELDRPKEREEGQN